MEHNGVVTVFAKDDPDHLGDPHCFKHSTDSDFESEYLPVEIPEEKTLAIINTGNGKDLITKLRDNLLEDIEKVRTNKEYIPQAKQACNLVNTLVNLVKLEMQMRKG
jgi:hypothetical protein